MSHLLEKLKDRNKQRMATESPLFGMKDRGRGVMREEVGKYKQEMMQEMRRMMEEMLGQEGLNTLKGDRGHTPIRGVDYLTEEEMNALRAELKAKDSINGRDADEEFVINEVLRKMPKHDLSGIVRELKDLKKNAAKEIDPKVMAQMLNSLHGNDRLDYRSLKNTPTIPDGKTHTVHRGGQGLAVFAQDISSQCDGSTRTFTVPVHTRALWLTTSSFPSTYRLTTDFTTSGTVLTIDSSLQAPASGETLIFGYAS
jgi:hypothetical protein